MKDVGMAYTTSRGTRVINIYMITERVFFVAKKTEDINKTPGV